MKVRREVRPGVYSVMDIPEPDAATRERLLAADGYREMTEEEFLAFVNQGPEKAA